jgi:hypothetical protein
MVLIGDRAAWVQDPTGLVVRELRLQVVAPDRVRITSNGAAWDTSVHASDRDHLRLESPRGHVTLERRR